MSRGVAVYPLVYGLTAAGAVLLTLALVFVALRAILARIPARWRVVLVETYVPVGGFAPIIVADTVGQARTALGARIAAHTWRKAYNDPSYTVQVSHPTKGPK